MANIFTIKHGTKKPANNVLQPYELGFSTEEGLFIGSSTGEAVPVSVQVTESNNGGKFIYYDAKGKMQASNLLILPSENFGTADDFPENPVNGQVYFVI